MSVFMQLPLNTLIIKYIFFKNCLWWEFCLALTGSTEAFCSVYLSHILALQSSSVAVSRLQIHIFWQYKIKTEPRFIYQISLSIFGPNLILFQHTCHVEEAILLFYAVFHLLCDLSFYYIIYLLTFILKVAFIFNLSGFTSYLPLP